MEDIIFSAKQVQGKKALFGKGRFALQNVDFELPSGYIMGIIGENGAADTISSFLSTVSTSLSVINTCLCILQKQMLPIFYL